MRPSQRGVFDGFCAEQRDNAGDPEQSVERVHGGELREEEFWWAKDGVLVFFYAVVQELECGPVVVDLPEEVGEGDEDEERDAEGGPAVEEEVALRCAEQAEAEGDEEERHRRLVEQAEAGGDAEDGPPEALGK